MSPMFTTTLMAVYSPLAWLTLAVNYVLGGMDPRGYHAGNIALHAASAGVLCLVARRRPGSGGGSIRCASSRWRG